MTTRNARRACLGLLAASAVLPLPRARGAGELPFGKIEDGTALPSAKKAKPPGDMVRPVRSNSPTARFDSVVALINARGFVCSGVLVDPRAVLTARHCLPVVRVVFGADVLDPRWTAPVIATSVPPAPGVDLALLRLATTAPVAPYRMRASADATMEIRTVHIVGFGTLDPYTSRGAGRRRWVDVVVRNWGCEDSSAARAGCYPNVEMLIPRANGNDSCRGDSGGAVLEDVPDGYRLVAITSRSIDRPLLPCGDGGIYVRVDRLNGWITKELQRSAQ